MKATVAHLVIITLNHNNHNRPHGGTTLKREILMKSLTQAKEKALKAANHETWTAQVQPMAALMLDGERYLKNHDIFTHSYGLEPDEAILTSKGKQAAQLIAAGRFVEGGELLQQAMAENCLEHTCIYLDLDIDEVKP